MIEDIKIERLKGSDKPELLNLYTQAFGSHPLIPAHGAKPEATRAVVKAFVDFFGGTKSSLLFGIRKDNRPVCAHFL